MITLASVIHYPATKSVEATWVDAEGAQVKCHCYADVQMQMFRDDVATLGGSIAEYESLIAVVEAGIVPPPPPTPEEVAAQAQIVADEYAIGVVKTNPVIQYLVTHTPDECVAKVQADVINLETAKVMLGHFAVALSVLARGKLR